MELGEENRMDDGNSDLRPCPLCGSVAKLLGQGPLNSPDRFVVKCSFCGCSVEGASDIGAVARWNQRVQFTLKERMEQIRKELSDLGSELMRMKQSGLYLGGGRKYTFKFCDDFLRQAKTNLATYQKKRLKSVDIECIRENATVFVNMTNAKCELLRRLSDCRCRVKLLRKMLNGFKTLPS